MDRYLTFGDKNTVILYKDFDELFSDYTQYIDSKEAILADKEVSELQGSEQYPQFGGIRAQTVTKFFINPSLNEAPNQLLTALNKRFLDFQLVRAEVILMCSDQTINSILPTHVYLLSNGEYDYSVAPPMFKIFFRQLKQKNIRFARRRRRRKFITRSWFIFQQFTLESKKISKKKKSFFYILSFQQFFRLSMIRNFAMSLRDNNDNDSYNTPAKSKLVSCLRSELGTIRSLCVKLISTQRQCKFRALE